MNNMLNFIINKLGNNLTPIQKQLIEMAKKNDVKGLETFGRNLGKEQGRDFDAELKKFMQNFKM